MANNGFQDCGCSISMGPWVRGQNEPHPTVSHLLIYDGILCKRQIYLCCFNHWDFPVVCGFGMSWLIQALILKQKIIRSRSLGSTKCLLSCEALHSAGEFFVVQSLSPVWVFATSWTAAPQASLSITNSQSLLILMSIELVMPSDNLILCYLLLLLPQSLPASGSFPVSWLFASGGQGTGASASTSVLPMSTQGTLMKWK